MLGIDQCCCAACPLHLCHGMVGQRGLPAALRPIHLCIPHVYPMGSRNLLFKTVKTLFKDNSLHENGLADIMCMVTQKWAMHESAHLNNPALGETAAQGDVQRERPARHRLPVM